MTLENKFYFFVCCCFLGGFKDGVFPRLSLLSRCRSSGLPVEIAIHFGPGLSAMVLIINLLYYQIYEKKLNYCIKKRIFF